MKIRIAAVLFLFVLGQLSVNGQESAKSKDGFYYDTVTILDHNTNEASERQSRMRKPITRNFYLKSDVTSYHLFKGNVTNLTYDQVKGILDDGFSLYVDKLEHKGHKNLKPSVLEILDENNEVIETVEDISQLEDSTLKRKLKVDSTVRLSGFMISVNEETMGPILLDVKIVE